jgi:hypothetical protein
MGKNSMNDIIENIIDWFSEYSRFVIGGIVLTILIILLIGLFPAKFVCGYVMDKYSEEHLEWNTEEEEEDQYRSETNPELYTYTDDDGNIQTSVRFVTRSVYDHTDIVTYHHIDDADFIIIVRSMDNESGYNWYERKFNKSREKKSFKFYIPVDIYMKLRLESSFIADRVEHWFYDNITRTEIARRNR